MPSPDTTDISISEVRREIRAILAKPRGTKSATGLSIDYVQDHLKSLYGADGSGFPGKVPIKGNLTLAESVASERDNIHILYAQWVLGSVATLPNEDPGRAEAGLGPLPNPIKSI